MAEVVGIGAALFDIIMSVDQFPSEDTKQQGKESSTQCGGPCATALVALSKLGHRVCYTGTVGNDFFGQSITAGLKKYGVSTDHVFITEGTSPHSLVLLNQTSGSRTCIWTKGTIPSVKKDIIDLTLLKGARYLHLDGNHLDCAVYAAQKAREFGILVSLDAGNPYPGIERLMPYVDILIPSEEFALKYTGCPSAQDAARQLEQQYHPSILIITQGSSGGFWWHNNQAIRYPVFPVSVLDSNGAGDTFHGAFLSAQLRGLNVEESCRFASAVSALKCTRLGAQQGIPSMEEVTNFMNTHHCLIKNI